MSKNLTQRIALSSALALSTLAGCRTAVQIEPQPPIKRQAPFYSTNLFQTSESEFGDRDFDSRLYGLDFGYHAGKRFVGRLNPEDIVDIEGSEDIDTSKVLPIWTLRVDEAGFFIDTESQRTVVKRPDNRVRVYLLNDKLAGIRTNLVYEVEHISRNDRAFSINEPEFWVPLNVVDGMKLGYATSSLNGKQSLDLVPNPTEYQLYEGRVGILGNVYNERWARLRESSVDDNCKIENLYTGEPIFKNIETGEETPRKE